MKILKQVLSLLFVRWAVVVVAFTTSVFVARAVGPEGRGILAVLNSSTLLLSVIAGFGLPVAVAYLYKQKQFPIDELLSVVIGFWTAITIITGALLFWQFDLFVRFLASESKTTVFYPIWLWLSFFTLPGLLVSTLLSVVLVIDSQTKLYVVWNLLSQCIVVLLIWILTFGLNFDITGVLIANACGQIVTIAIMVYWLRLIAFSNFSVRWHTFLQLLRLGSQQYLVTVFSNIFKRGENLLLIMLLDLKAVGYYAVAMGLYELLVDIPRSITIPMIGAISDVNNTNQAENTAQSIRIQLLMMSGLIVIVALISPSLVLTFYGAAFQAALLPFLFLLPGVLFRTIHLGAYSYFTGTGRPGVVSVSVIAAAVISLGLDIVLVPRLGLVGAAIGTLLAEVCMALLSIRAFILDSKSNWKNTLLPQRSEIIFLLQKTLLYIKESKGKRVPS